MPSKPGVYVFLDKNQRILYVGKAKDLKARVSSYFTSPPSSLGPKTATLVEKIELIRITVVESEIESLLLEAFYIKKYKPKYNVRLTDNKSYPLVRITINQKYPALLLARRMDDPESLYFGPFPNSSAVRLVLKTIRRIFPFVSVLNHPKKTCLYFHLGLCPCPPVNDSPKLYKAYKLTIKRIIRMFEGDSKKLIKELERERDKKSKAENFEEAYMLQKQINALLLITQPIHQPFEYHINPNLITDIRTQEINELMEILNSHGYSIKKLSKIECFDISNIQGKHATGSQVVFVNGEKEGSLYRRYRVKIDGKPNDFAMMKEVISRRFKNKQWEYPDLVVVDGGKGQISSALKAMQELSVTCPVIGLAKREETIITSTLKEISLPKNSDALKLIMRIRDEAHRFALFYHRKLRSKYVLQN